MERDDGHGSGRVAAVCEHQNGSLPLIRVERGRQNGWLPLNQTALQTIGTLTAEV